MKKKSQEPVDCFVGIFTARRDLLKPIREAVVKPVREKLPGAEFLTVDEADTLTLLHRIREHDWDDAPVDSDGFVPVRALRLALVHDPGKFSRRISLYQDRELIEVRKAEPKRKLPRAARITNKGIKIAREVWERYRKLAALVLEGIPRADLEAHCRVNKKISKGIEKLARPGWSRLVD